MIVHLMVLYCMSLNPYICRAFELTPSDGHKIASIGECMRRGMVGSAEFEYDHTRWFVKGASCREEHEDDVNQALNDIKRRLEP